MSCDRAPSASLQGRGYEASLEEYIRGGLVDRLGFEHLTLNWRSHDGDNVIITIFRGMAEIAGRYARHGAAQGTCRQLMSCFKTTMNVLDTLRRGGLDVNARGASGWTALHYACLSYDAAALYVPQLLARGADPCIPNGLGLTPLDCLGLARRRLDKARQREIAAKLMVGWVGAVIGGGYRHMPVIVGGYWHMPVIAGRSSACVNDSLVISSACVFGRGAPRGMSTSPPPDGAAA
jgi:hypothetical protein